MELDDGGGPSGGAAPRMRLEELLLQLVDRAQETLQTQERLRGLLQANQAVVGDLDLPTVLRRIAESARDLVGAQYAALGVIAPDGSGLEQFVYVGMTTDDARRIGHLPEGKGLLGALIDDPYPIRLDHFDDDVRAVGLPPGHPAMDSFLGVPITVRGEVFGNLYLADSSSGRFDDEDQRLVTALAATAGIAIQNARLFAQSRLRQEWLQASAEVTRHLLSVEGPQDLQILADTAHRLADADQVVVLSVDAAGTQLTVTAVSGAVGARHAGSSFPLADSALGRLLESRSAVLVEHAAPDTRECLHDLVGPGPTMVLPLVGGHGARSLLVCGRRAGRRTFSDDDLETAAMFATHASHALELVAARQDQQRVALLDDRSRIARDLHDHVIQQLFAAGMTLQGLTVGIDDPIQVKTLDKVVDTLDEAVKQIRTSIFRLRPDDDGGASLRAAVLGVVADVVPVLSFEPQVSFDGPVDAVSDDALAADVVAVVREGLSNVAKHARAQSARVHVHASVRVLEVTVEDDGIGVGAPARTSGLANLRHRAERRRGQFVLEAAASGRGTVLRFSVPLG